MACACVGKGRESVIVFLFLHLFCIFDMYTYVSDQSGIGVRRPHVVVHIELPVQLDVHLRVEVGISTVPSPASLVKTLNRTFSQ